MVADVDRECHDRLASEPGLPARPDPRGLEEIQQRVLWPATAIIDGLGVDSFGQSGSVADLYRASDLDCGSIVNAALAALSLR